MTANMLSRYGSRPRPLCAMFAAAALTAGLTGCSGPSIARPPSEVPTSAAATTSTPPPASRYIFGQITAEEASVWTVQGIRGNVYTVTITPMTSFGTLFHGVPRGQFKVGDTVRIAGNFSGTAITATSVNFSKHGLPNTPGR